MKLNILNVNISGIDLMIIINKTSVNYVSLRTELNVHL